MKTHRFRTCIKMVSREEGDVCKDCKCVNGLEQLSYWYSGTFIFLECRSVLNAIPVANAFLSCTLLSICFFLMIFQEKV